MKPDVLFLHDLVVRSQANGPGLRSVVWVQGCQRSCVGCWNQNALVFDKRHPTKVTTLATVIAEVNPDGVTFSGGEPFSQASALANLAMRLRLLCDDTFSVVCFTGHTHKQIIQADRKDWNALLREIDLLVDGEYVQTLRCFEPLRGSKNQRLHFLTNRIRPADLTASRTEYALATDGRITVTGFPTEVF